MGIIAWEGIERTKADEAYDVLKDKLPKYGMAMEVNKDSLYVLSFAFVSFYICPLRL